MKIFSHSLFGGPNYDAEVTAGLYEQDQLRNYGSLFDGGHNKRTPKTTTTEPSGFVPLVQVKNSSMFEGGKGDWMDKTEISAFNNIGRTMIARKSFGKGENAITWDEGKQSYFHKTLGVVPNKASLFKLLNTGGKKLSGNFRFTDFFKSIPDWDGRQYMPEKIEEEKGWKLFSPSTW